MLYPKITFSLVQYTSTLARFSLTILWFLLFVGFGMGQEEITFTHYETEENTTIDHVSSIIQDQRGWLWMGTRGTGLKRFDGQKFTYYKSDPGAPNSLIDNDIMSIHEDHKGKIWIATFNNGLDCYNPDTDQFVHYRHQADDPNSISSNIVRCAIEDELGYIWVGTYKGLDRLDPSTGHFKHFRSNQEKTNSLNYSSIFSLLKDSKGQIWVGTREGLNRYEEETKDFISFKDGTESHKFLSQNLIRALHEDHNGTLWIGTLKNGFGRLDPNTQVFKQYIPDPNNKMSQRIKSIIEDKDGLIWVATYGGLFRFDPQTEQFTGYLPDSENPQSFNNRVDAIFQDAEGIYWMGTDNGGLYSFEWEKDKLQHYQHDFTSPFSLSNNMVNCVYKDSKETYWIGTSNGLNRFDPITEKFYTYLPNGIRRTLQFEEIDNSINQIFEDTNGTFWIGTNAGLKQFDRSEEKFINPPSVPKELRNNTIICIYEDHNDQIWIGTQPDGLFLYNPNIDSFIPYWNNNNGDWIGNVVLNVFEDTAHRLWVSTADGLLLFDQEKKHLHTFKRELANPTSLSNNSLGDIHQDSKGTLWIATSNGLNWLQTEEPYSFRHFLEKDGLSGATIIDIMEDTKGHLWISSYHKGFSIFNPDEGNFRNFHELNGVKLDGWKAPFYQDKETGKMWLGTEKGLFIFHPDSLPHNDLAPPIHISRLSFYDYKNKEAGFRPLKAPWSKSSITLPYHQNTISAEFSVLSYKKPSQNEAAYQLEGVNDDWINIGNKREATFSNLRPGSYTLRVKGSNNDGVWNEEGASLQITILPPWWLTIWAKIAYFLLAAATLYNGYHYQLKRKLALAETLRLQELDAVKTKLFTNITHEFRTPLTVIQGMARQEIEKEGAISAEKNLENAKMINRNSAQLLTLVNQMLDLRKLESGAMAVNMVKGDVIQYLKYLTESFHSYAGNKNIGLHFLAEKKELVMDYDPEKLLYIVSNLLSNAIKFTPDGGNVYFSVNAQTSKVSKTLEVYTKTLEVYTPEVLELRIKDTGVGIEAEKLPRIFDRFYQADDSVTRQGEGSGVGLALTKELVKLLGGEIEVSSELGEGSVFTVSLPITQEAETEMVETVNLKEKVLGFTGPEILAAGSSNGVIHPLNPLSNFAKASSNKPAGDSPLALIIEDNPDVVRYLSSCLESEYKIVTAFDGQTGIETAIDVIPDIIVSDVMMPKKDGYEVCEILKNDERTSHIPIILLTAKADLDSRIEGLSKGADAYLAKPFHREELQVRLAQLIEIRKKLQERYAGLNPEDMNEKTYLIEDEFLRKVRKAVEENISDSEFGLLQLCRAVGLSRSQLFRKLKALTGKSTTLVIRSIRLQRARQLLQNKDLNVSEVAYEVGFKDLAYFSRCFQDEYGEAPSTVRSA